MENLILRALHQQPIAYYPIYRQLTGTLQGGVLLSQIMYWFSQKDKFWKTNDQFRAETQLTEYEIRTAKNTICNLPFITKTKEQIPAKTFYEIDWDLYKKTIGEFIENATVRGKSTNKKRDKSQCFSVRGKSPNKYVENQRTSTWEINELVRGKSTNKYVGNQRANTKTTTKTTTENILSKDKNISCKQEITISGRKSKQHCSINNYAPRKIKSNNSCSTSKKICRKIKNNNYAPRKIKSNNYAPRKIKSNNSCSTSKNVLREKSCSGDKDSAAKYTHTVSDLRNYTELLTHGITSHRSENKAKMDSLDKLHALFSSKCKPPYHQIHLPKEFVDHKWTIDDIAEIFKFHLEHAPKYGMKPVRAIGKFIFFEGFNGNKSWSPLIYWAQKMLKTDDSLTEEGAVLFKSMKHHKLAGAEKIDSSIINCVSAKLKEAEKRHIFVDPTSRHMSYPLGIVSVFIKYLKEKLNNLNFKLVYMTKTDFVDEFLLVANKRNILKPKNNRKNINEP